MTNRNLIPRSFQLFAPLFEDDDWFGRPMTGFNDEKGLTVSEDETEVHVEAALPGLSADDIEVVYQKGILWIKGEKRSEEGDKEKKFYRKAMNSFSYSVALPESVDASTDPEATYEHGVMRVTFAKHQAETPRRIQVRIK